MESIPKVELAGPTKHIDSSTWSSKWTVAVEYTETTETSRVSLVASVMCIGSRASICLQVDVMIGGFALCWCIGPFTAARTASENWQSLLVKSM